MAKTPIDDKSVAKKIEDLQNRNAKLDPPPEEEALYKPNKRNRHIRRSVYERFYVMRDAPVRTEAEAEWEIADKEYGMIVDPLEDGDWRSNLHLPDAWAAIQSQSQETIERKSRPNLIATESSDEPITEFCNTVMTYNMNSTGFDYQGWLSKLSASIRGTSFRMDYWRTERRVVKLPKSVNDDGTIEYEDKEIVDFDDDYTEWRPAEYIYPDERAKHIDEAVDLVDRLLINIDEFHRMYDDHPDYFDTEFVKAGGDTNNKSRIFKLPDDITGNDVEVLRYYNRAVDAFWVVANNVTVRDSPLPNKHKELPIAVDYQYRIPGKFYGIGIPRVIHVLSEERKSIRNLNMDRQKMQLNKMFLHNNLYDIDDGDLVTRPHGLISVDTNGQDIRQALVPVEYGDVGPSYFKSEEILLEDIRRATGIDDRIQGVNMGGTATEAAILKESSLKRINLISFSNEMDSVIRLGRLKWSNIQFFYGAPRLDSIGKDNESNQQKKYRTISAEGQKFEIITKDGNKALSMENVKGHSALELKPEYSKYLEGSFDVTVDADIFTPVSKAIEQTKKTEMYSLLLSNPATLAVMDVNGATADVLRVNNIKPDVWLKNVQSKHDMQMLAEDENTVMFHGQPLSPTEGATEEHTLMHLMFTKSQDFQAAPGPIQQIITNHIMGEHDANPATGASADLLKGYGLTGPDGGPGGAAAAGLPMPPGMSSPFAGGVSSNTSQPQAPVADLQPTNFAAPE